MREIRKPFGYIGCKKVHYAFIKRLFEGSGKRTFVDLFGGGMYVPVNLSQEHPDVRFVVNVFDDQVKTCIENRHRLAEVYQRAVEFITDGEKIENSVHISRTDKARWERMKDRYREMRGRTVCPCCLRWIAERSKKYFDDEIDEKLALMMMSVNPEKGSGWSLKQDSIRPDKKENITRWAKAVDRLKLSYELFDETAHFENAFIVLDPPYISSLKKEHLGYAGVEYRTNMSGAATWTHKDDERLVGFVLENLDRGNEFLIFGAHGNHLHRLINERLGDRATMHDLTRKKSMFGKSAVSKEYAAHVK